MAKEKMILNAFAKVLRKERTNFEKSQRIFAFENGIHKSMISRFESGNNEPKLFSVWRIANALDMKPSEFLAAVEKELPEAFNILDI